MKQCNLVGDLLPLYIDGLTSPESASLIEAHLAECGDCRQRLEQMRVPVEGAPVGGDYKAAVKQQKRRLLRRTVLWSLAALAAGALVCLLILWKQDVFSILDQKTAPGGSITVTAYAGTEGYLAPGQTSGFRIRSKGTRDCENIYNDAAYGGMWWSPDGQLLLVSFLQEGQPRLDLIDFTLGENAALQGRLNQALSQAPQLTQVPRDDQGAAEVRCTFLRWSEDSRAILLLGEYQDAQGQWYSGYFWFDCTQDQLMGITEFYSMQAAPTAPAPYPAG